MPRSFMAILLLLISSVQAYGYISSPADFLPVLQDLSTDKSVTRKSDLDASAAMSPRPKLQLTTNAERLARGLPPLPPRSLSRRRAAAAAEAAREVKPRSPSRIERTRRGSPSGIPDPLVTRRGSIEVFDADSGRLLGLLKATPNTSGLFNLATSEDEALAFTFSSRRHDTQIDILTENSSSQSTFPNFGVTAPLSVTLGPGSSRFGLIVETEPTPPGSKPMSVGNSLTAATRIPGDSESAVWSFDSDTRELSPTWVNPDGSNLLPTVVVFLHDALAITGDLKAFRDNFGDAPRVILKYRSN